MNAESLGRTTGLPVLRAWKSSARVGPDAHGGQILSMLPIVLALFAAALYLQLTTYPNHDVAWVLWGTRELLSGAKWGVDIIEPNPPLAWYLSMPSTLLAVWLGVPLDWTFKIAVAVAAAVSAIAFASIASSESRFRRAFLCAVSSACLLLLPGREFGQREHLAAIAVLPYLALAGRRAAGEHGVSARASISIGLAMGLGVALKPYFLAVPLLVEMIVQLTAATRPKLLRAENVASAGVVAIYSLFLILFGRQYLADVVPLANEIYWSFNRPMGPVMDDLYPGLTAVSAFAAYAIYKKDRPGLVLFAAFCGFALSYILQRKGYPYHLLPVSIVVMVMLAHVSTVGHRVVRGLALIVMFLFSLSVVQPPLYWWGSNKPGGSRAAEIDGFRETIARHAANGRFLVVAVHPYPSFPTAIYTPAHYVSRTNSQWFLPAVVQIRQGVVARPDAARIEGHAREFVMHDLAAKPGLVLIDKDAARHTVGAADFDILAFYLEDPAFREVWSAYREIEPIGEYRQFVRAESVAPAAEPKP
jgi:hypothetical protein